jgi:hypothetical protein
MGGRFAVLQCLGDFAGPGALRVLVGPCMPSSWGTFFDLSEAEVSLLKPVHGISLFDLILYLILAIILFCANGKNLCKCARSCGSYATAMSCPCCCTSHVW